MPSPRPMGPSLRLRIAASSALVAALVGSASAGVSAMLVERFTTQAEDARLVDVGELLLAEMASEGGDPIQHVEEEAREVAPRGLGVALFERGIRRGGSPDLPHAPEGCGWSGGGEASLRICAIGGESRRIVVATRRTGREALARSSFLAVLCAAALSAMASAALGRALAGWALAPLSSLGKRLGHVTSVDPGQAELGPPSGTSEVDALRDTIQALLGRLGDALARSRSFSASAAHELRTPLAAALAELDLVLEQTVEAREPLARIRRNLARLSVLAERLLALTSERADSLVLEPVALEDVAREVVASRDPGERSRLELRIDAPGMVRGDEALLRTVVDNLIDNALKFSREAVSVSVEERGEDVWLCVRDRGTGIAEADARRLLLPFERGAAGGVPGHGLGLAIIEHAARLHQGELHLGSRDDGAEVRVRIPRWTR